jgi:hypothetical protein
LIQVNPLAADFLPDLHDRVNFPQCRSLVCGHLILVIWIVHEPALDSQVSAFCEILPPSLQTTPLVLVNVVIEGSNFCQSGEMALPKGGGEAAARGILAFFAHPAVNRQRNTAAKRIVLFINFRGY